MISAIFEILFLLSVSCAIGIFFTYRYWKAKTKSLTARIDELEVELEKKIADNNVLSLKEEVVDQESIKKAELKADKQKDKNKELKKTIELLEEQLGEKEREIESLSIELEKKKVSYYKQINGKRYKAITLLKADEAVDGQGDGRISKSDAEKIFATISDGKTYTQVEKDTMRYLRDNYNWTESADELFRTKVRSWAAKGHELD